ncbi:MAG: hypothetical protein SQA66_07815 [Candidatus Fervidibacter sacchari]
MPAGYAVQGEPAGPAGELTDRFSAHLPSGSWLMSGAVNGGMPTEAEIFIWHKPKGRFQFGVGLLAKPQTARWLLNYELQQQKGSAPSITVGVGLQEVGVGNPGIFATANWALTNFLKMPSSLYLGTGRRITLDGKTLDKSWVPLLGFSSQVAKGVSATVQMDGRKWHGVLSARAGEFRAGIFAFKFKTIGIIVGWRD